MEYKLYEVSPLCPTRTEMGRVVINPPNLVGELKPRVTQKILMCCNRAYLTEESYKKHLDEKSNHGEPLDLNTLPRSNPFERLGKAIHDRSSTEFWMSRKTGIPEKFRKIIERENSELDDSWDDVEDTDGEHGPGKASDSRKRSSYTCPVCNISIHPCNKRRHNESHHVKDGKFKCQYCPCNFALESKRRNHESREHTFKGTSSTSFKNALIAKAKKKLLIAPPKPNTLLKLQKGNRNSKVCPECGKKFSKMMALRDHMNTHTGSRPYRCDVCGYKFTFISNLFRHKRVAHEKAAKFFCEVCKCGFSSNLLLKRHMNFLHSKKKTMDSPKLKSFDSVGKIPTNGNASLSEDSIQIPSLTLQHPDPLPNGLYECPECQKQLSTPQSWRGHMRIHQNVKPYKCDQCGISFRLHATRSSHIKKAHSGGEFRCNNCSCQFQYRRALLRHVDQYHGKKLAESASSTATVKITANINCKLCGKYFRTTNDYQEHQNLHANPPRDQCDLCLQIFTEAKTVALHKARAHVNGAHRCPICCVQYSESRFLFRHLVKMHGMQRTEWNFSQKAIHPECLRRILKRLYERDLAEGGETNNKKYDEELAKANESELAEKTSESKRFKCSLCPAKLRTKMAFKLHMQRSHYNSGQFRCAECPARFMNNAGLVTHKTLYHGHVGFKKMKELAKLQTVENNAMPNGRKLHHAKTGLRYLCIYCDKTFSEQFYSIHMEAHKFGRTYQCDICSMRFNMPSSLRTHKKTSHDHNGRFKCPQCPCKYTTDVGLTNHLNLHRRIEKEDKQKITESGDDSSSEQLIQKKSVPNFKHTWLRLNLECDLCPYKSSKPDSIHRHKLRCHLHDGEFQCKYCTCKFLTSVGLKCHVSQHHHDETAKSRSETDNLSEHTQTPQTKQVRQKPECLTCGKIFTSKSGLDGHMQIHTRPAGELRFSCDICHQKFLHPGSIEAHKKRSHFHDGQFQCADCPCKFVSNGGLIIHRARYHAPPTTTSKKERKTFYCNLCNKFFNRKRSFLTHMMKHPNQDLMCDSCDQKFLTMNDLNLHKLNCNVSGRNHQCELCSCKFDTPSGLEWHLKRYHGRSEEAAKLKTDISEVQDQFSSQEDNTSAADNLQSEERKRVTCELCNLQLGLHTKLSCHKRTSHVKNGQFRCADCTCQFVSLRSLSRHRGHFHRDTGVKLFLENSLPIAAPDISGFKFNPIKLKAPAMSMVSTIVQAHKVLKNTIMRSIRHHKCQLCGSTYKRKLDLEKHKQISHTNGSYKCKICVCSFHSSSGLKGHIKIHKPKKPKENSFSTGNENETLDEVVINVNQNTVSVEPKLGVIKCKFCGSTFNKKSNLTYHLGVAHANGEFKCSQCCCCFHSSFGLRRHVAKQHNSTSHNLSSNSTDEQISSETLNNGEPANVKSPIKRAKCDLCGMTFTRSNYVAKHKQVAHSDGRFKCKQCICCFHKSIGLLKHSLRHKTGSSIPFKKLNGKTVSSLHNVSSSNEANRSLSPVKVNHNFLKIRPLAVQVQTNFNQKSIEPLVSEIESQSEFQEKSNPPIEVERQLSKPRKYPFQCGLCGFRFSCKMYFVRHGRKAHVAGGHKCDSCTCSFADLYNLSAHKLAYHTVNGKKKVGVCNLARVQKRLQNSGKSKFNCTLCSAKFVRKRAVQLHMDNAHSGGDHKCELCPCTFNSLQKFSAHKKLYHKRERASFLKPTQRKSRSKTADSNLVTRSDLTLTTPPKEHVSPSRAPVQNEPQQIEQTHQKAEFKCDWCSKLFLHQRLLNFHILSHTRPEVCHKCNGRFRTKDEIARHIKAAHGNGAFQCYICSCRFASALGMKQHVALVHTHQKSSSWKNTESPNNFIIEHEQENYYESEQFLSVEAVDPLGNTDSEPVIQGILETNYSNGNVHFLPDSQSGQYEEDSFADASEPIIEGVLDYGNGSHFEDSYNAPSTAPLSQPAINGHAVARKKTFTPKTRPMKCSTCGEICLGPDNFRQHMESHGQNEESRDEEVVSSTENAVDQNIEIQCVQCSITCKSADELVTHHQLEHDKTGHYRCVYCPCTMKTETNLRSHFIKYHCGK